MTDEEFQAAIEMLLKGNKEGLKKIYDSYMRFVYAVIYDTLKNREDAEDVTSEFFIKLIRVAGSYKIGSGHRMWLATIARNMAIDYIRKNKKEVLSDEWETMGEKDNQAHSGESTVEEKTVLSEDMRIAMQTLSPKEKEVVDMKLLGQLKFKEIAQITGQPMGTVSWLYNQGISKLRRCLSGYEG